MVLRAIAEIAPQLVACGMNTAIDNRPPHFPEGIALTGLTGEEFADLFAVVAPRAAPFGAMPYHRGRPAALTLRDKLMICLAHSSQGLSMKALAAAWGVTGNPISSAIASTRPLFTDDDLRRVRADGPSVCTESSCTLDQLPGAGTVDRTPAGRSSAPGRPVFGVDGSRDDGD